MALNLALLATQKARVHCRPQDATGQAATVDGPPVWKIPNQTVAKALPDANGLDGWIEAVAPGFVMVTVEADALAGSGTQIISEMVHVTVTATQPPTPVATRIVITNDPPVPK